jgi:replicative DNA helicase
MIDKNRNAAQLPPSLCNEELERTALGAALWSKQQAEELIRDASVELFTTNYYRDVFTAILALGPDALDAGLLADELDRTGKHVDPAVLGSFYDGYPLTDSMKIRITRLRELHRLRELARLGERLGESAFEAGVKSRDLIASVREQLEAISQ